VLEVENRELNDAFSDRLTNLPNRDFLIARLEQLA
jgi:GGDEF domain-containing protein